MKGLCLKKSCRTTKKLIWILFNLFSFSSLWFSSYASAALNLELTQGVANQLPVAMVPFVSTESFSPENNMSRVIESDLTHSGQFKVIWIKTQASNSDKVSVSYWRAHHIDDVVLGKITPIRAGTISSACGFSACCTGP